jgi:hypothetical protein
MTVRAWGTPPEIFKRKYRAAQSFFPLAVGWVLLSPISVMESNVEKSKADQYSERETQRRVKALVQTALNTRPKSLKDISKKNGEARTLGPREKRKKRARPA